MEEEPIIRTAEALPVEDLSDTAIEMIDLGLELPTLTAARQMAREIRRRRAADPKNATTEEQ